MREGWKEVKLGELTSVIKRGISPKYVKDNGLRIINQKCIRNNKLSYTESRLSSWEKKVSENKKIKIGDVLINSTGTGTLGRTAPVKKLEKETTVDTHVTIVRANDEIDNLFLGYLLSYSEPLITALGKGATNQIELSASDLAVMKVTIPKSKETQRKIASILSAYDDLIENNLQRIKLLEEQAQLTYEEWFVRMKFPGHEKAVIDEESGLPVGWENGTLSDIVDFQNGFAYKSKKFTKSGFPIVKIKNISNLTIDFSSTDFIDDEYAQNTEKFRLDSGELVMAMTGATVGKVGVIPISKKPLYLNQRVGCFQNIKFNAIPFIKAFFTAGKGEEEVINLARGAAQPNISRSQILSIKLKIPPVELFKSFNDKYIKNIELINILLNQNQLLKEARDLLLPRLMMGLSVPMNYWMQIKRIKLRMLSWGRLLRGKGNIKQINKYDMVWRR